MLKYIFYFPGHLSPDSTKLVQFWLIQYFSLYMIFHVSTEVWTFGLVVACNNPFCSTKDVQNSRYMSATKIKIVDRQVTNAMLKSRINEKFHKSSQNRTHGKIFSFTIKKYNFQIHIFYLTIVGVYCNHFYCTSVRVSNKCFSHHIFIFS